MTKEEILDFLQEICSEWGRVLDNSKYEYSDFEWSVLRHIGGELIGCFDEAIDSIREDLEEEEEE